MASSGVGGAGGAGCIDEQGTGKTKTSCNSMKIAPASAGSVCGPNMTDDSPGYTVCQHLFDVLTAGLAEDTYSCLSKISGDATNACDIKQVSACVLASLQNACDRPEIATYCQDTSMICKNGTLGKALCESDLRALNDAALSTYTDCMKADASAKTCEEVHEECFSVLIGS